MRYEITDVAYLNHSENGIEGGFRFKAVLGALLVLLLCLLLRFLLCLLVAIAPVNAIFTVTFVVLLLLIISVFSVTSAGGGACYDVLSLEVKSEKLRMRNHSRMAQ
jgi:hypothetical protein